MKIIVEYTVLNGRRLKRGKTERGAKFLFEHEVPAENAADFPRQRFDYFVEESSDVGKAIWALLGLSAPT
jgi:hypothetical protein